MNSGDNKMDVVIKLKSEETERAYLGVTNFEIMGAEAIVFLTGENSFVGTLVTYMCHSMEYYKVRNHEEGMLKKDQEGKYIL